MSNGSDQQNLIIDAINQIADDLCTTINGNFDITIEVSHSHESIQKLAMMTNFLLDTVRRKIKDLKKSGEVNQLIATYNNKIFEALDTTKNFNDIITIFIKSICEILHLDVGHYYQYNNKKDTLSSSKLWHQTKDIFNDFKVVTEKTDFNHGIGLPGTAWKQQQPIFYEDVNKSTNFTRAALVKNLNIKGGIAIPIFDQRQILGVIECYSLKTLVPSTEQLQFIEKISHSISLLYRLYLANRNYNLILDAAGEGIYGLDSNGNTTFVNPAVCNMLGYTADELIGRPMHPLIHYNHPDGTPYLREQCPMYAAFHDGKVHHIIDEVLWKKDGSALPVRYTSTPMCDGDTITGAVVTFSDITEETNIKKYIDAIAVIQKKYIEGTPINELFDYILNALLNFTESEYGFIGPVLTNKDNQPYLKAYAITNIAWNKETQKFFDENVEEGIEFRNLDTLFGYSMKYQQVIISNDPASDERSGGLPQGHPKLRSYLGIPIFGSSGLVAMFGVANKKGGYDTEIIDQLTPMVNAISSIVESMRHYSVIQDMARHDQLTRVFNRAYFETEIHQIIENHSAHKTKFALFLLDLNRFKDVNDRLGHAIGDKLLSTFTNRLKKNIKKEDIICRIGGDEFVIITQNIHSYSDAGIIAKHIYELSQKNYKLDEYNINCDVSIGIACYPMAGKTFEELMKHADFALYRAKKEKGYQYYTEGLEQEFMHRILLEESLPKAIKNADITLAFQPQVDLTTQNITGFEVLARWNHPIAGQIPPHEFINLAEELGLAEALNLYIVTKTLTLLKQLNTKYKTPLKVAINLSPFVHKIEIHIQNLLKMVLESKLNPKQFRIEFEITESGFIKGTSNSNTALIKTIKEVNRAGITMAIDDFGIKYSSINRLLEFKFDTIKIDLSFTQRLDKPNNETAVAIIETLLFLAEKVNFTVIAEGVETEQQAKLLRRIGCKYAQGYLYFKPMTFDKLTQVLTNPN